MVADLIIFASCRREFELAVTNSSSRVSGGAFAAARDDLTFFFRAFLTATNARCRADWPTGTGCCPARGAPESGTPRMGDRRRLARSGRRKDLSTSTCCSSAMPAAAAAII